MPRNPQRRPPIVYVGAIIGAIIGALFGFGVWEMLGGVALWLP